MARRISSNSLQRSDPKGNLYYIRLKTEYGKFYKIGFTTARSVHDRMSYAGSLDWKYIDKVIAFVYLPDAFKVEQKLHAYLNHKVAFGKYSADPEFPLSGNGQSELYVEDVLGLDPEYTLSQKMQTESKLKQKRLTLANKSAKQDMVENLFVSTLTRVLLILLFPLALALIIILSILEGEDTKKEVAAFLDRLTGGKREAIRKEEELEQKLRPIINRLKIEMTRSEF